MALPWGAEHSLAMSTSTEPSPGRTMAYKKDRVMPDRNFPTTVKGWIHARAASSCTNLNRVLSVRISLLLVLHSPNVFSLNNSAAYGATYALQPQPATSSFERNTGGESS